MRLVGGVVLGAVALTACSASASVGGASLDQESVEAEIERDLTEFAGVAPEAIDCTGIADIEVDTNRYLHRRVGAFRWRRGAWWLHNLGSAIVLDVADLDRGSRVSVAPGSGIPLSFARSIVRFQAGSSTYELLVSQSAVTAPGEWSSTDDDDDDDDPTVTSSSVPLNREQRLLLAGLAQRRLRDPGAPLSSLATNREVAEHLGWTKTKFDRKLDNLCVKFATRGVPGLVGGQGSTAALRRERLIDHVLVVGLIGPDDLGDYEAAGQ